MHTYHLSLIALVVLALGGRAAGQADQPVDPFQVQSIPPENPDAGASGGTSNSADVPGQAGGLAGMSDLFPRMILSIVLVMGLGVAALFLSKKVLPKMTRGSAKEIRVLETIYLGPRKALHLVEVGHRKLLIGSTNESITPLATVSDEWLEMPKSSADDMVSQ